MEYTVEKNEKPNVMNVTFNADFEELKPYIEKVYKRNRGKFSLAGFRKGKAPRRMIEMQYGEDIFYEDALMDFLNDHYPKALDENDLEPVDQPELDVMSLSKEEGIKVLAVVPVRPEVTLGQYKGVEITKADDTVSEEDVMNVIKEEQDKNARIVPVERGIKKDDAVILDLDVHFTDEEHQDKDYSRERIHLICGEGTYPDFLEEGILGLKPEEEKDIPGVMEEMDCNVHVKIYEVKEKQLPELDDDFAMDVSDFDTFDEYKADLTKQLQENKKEQAKRRLQYEVVDAGIKNMEVEIHPAMVEAAQDRIMDNYKYQIEQQGIPFKEFLKFAQTDEQKLREEMKEGAVHQVKEELFMKAVIEAENIEATQEEIDEKIKEQAEMMEADEETVRKIFEAQGFDYFKQEITWQKALEMLVEEAKLVEAKEEPQEETSQEPSENQEEQAQEENKEETQEEVDA